MRERIITSLDKGLQLLSVLAEASAPQSLADLSRRFPWDKSTVYRTLETLKARGFVRAEDGGYLLGPSAIALGRGGHAPALLERARQWMARAAAESGENAHLAVQSGDEMLFIDQCAGGRFTLHTQVGGREPLHCTAIGKAYLVTLSPSAEDMILARLPYPQFTKRTLVDSQALAGELRGSRRRGYAVDDREYSDDVRCVAVPLVDDAGRFQAALGISGPASRVSTVRMHELGEILVRIIAAPFAAPFNRLGVSQGVAV